MKEQLAWVLLVMLKLRYGHAEDPMDIFIACF